MRPVIAVTRTAPGERVTVTLGTITLALAYVARQTDSPVFPSRALTPYPVATHGATQWWITK